LPDTTSEISCDTLARRANHFVIPEAGGRAALSLFRRLVRCLGDLVSEMAGLMIAAELAE
jgi:hypothetical protein